MLSRYVGSDARSYGDYLDASTGRMLEAEPGELAVYDVLVAPGRNPGLPLPPGDGRWAAVGMAGGGLMPEATAEDSSDEGGADDAPGAAEPPAEPEPEAAPEPEPAEPFAEPADPDEPPEPAEPEDGAEAPAEPGPDLPSLPGESTGDEPAQDDQAAAEAALNEGVDQ